VQIIDIPEKPPTECPEIYSGLRALFPKPCTTLALVAKFEAVFSSVISIRNLQSVAVRNSISKLNH